MEVNEDFSQKKGVDEVVLMIPSAESRESSPKPKSKPVEHENPPSSSQVSNLTRPSSQELTQSIPTPSELPNIPTKKSISQFSFKRMKSRSMEDDEDVCKTVDLVSQVMSVVVLAQLVAFVCITGLLIASLTIPCLRNTVVWEVRLWRWCLLMLAVLCGSLVTDCLITLLVLLIKKKYLLKKNVLYFLFALKDSAEVFAWLCLVLLAWVWLTYHGVKRSRHTTTILNWVTRALASCLIGATLWLIKTFLIKLLAFSFQRKRFFHHIHDYIFQFYVIRTLSRPKDKVGSPSIRVMLRLNKCIKGAVRKLEVNISKLPEMKLDEVSAWTTIKLIDVISRWDELSPLTDSLDEVEQQDKEITDEKKAKELAKAIFKTVAKPGSKLIEEDDLLRFMPKEHIEKFFDFFPEAKETRKIRKSFFKSWMVNVYRKGKSLTHSLDDAKTAIEELNNLASAVLLIVVIILWLLLTGLLKMQVLIFISSQLLLFVFIFGDAAKQLFEAILFVFVMHPFDVSDCCVVDEVEMEVEDMNILTTVFLKNNGEKISYPNSVLSSKPISNFNRSPNMSESVEFMVDFSTSVKSLEALKYKITMYLDSKPKDWNPVHRVVVKEIVDAGHLKMALHVTHKTNFQNATERTDRRSNLVLELKKILEELRVLPQ
ncbi:mechanosensitive ion channel protein 10-like [Syzygium oleosum]|uniref:mechanosensitive ion channel protein 10-like n=1 Tax=Syzygium oleosum TaxID=219896 RepID=UPI0024BAADAD|nr:mechanosensitive ion channel protein 10-like [Syzygium oleosum]